MATDNQDRQVKSRDRVRNHGEVFTAPREVNAMLDLVKDETERIDSRFLEPACGDGNFLAEILRRKLAVCDRRYGHSVADWERASFLSCTSVYGIDLLADNVAGCRERLFGIWRAAWMKVAGESSVCPLEPVIRFVFEANILCGNALTMRRVDEHGNDLSEPIIFTEWNIVTGDQVKRRAFRFDQLQRNEDELLFAWAEENQAFVPTPVRECPPVDFREVANG